MTVDSVSSLPPRAGSARRWVVDVLCEWAAQSGYVSIDVPVLEPTDIYLKRSGAAILGSLYSFVEPGGRRVSLRPEFTASAVRAFVLAGLESALWQYAGPVFRFEPDQNPERFQFGVERFGSGGVAVDAALIDLAAKGLAELGVKSRIVLGHVGVIAEALHSFGLSDRARDAVLSSISFLDEIDGVERARQQLAEQGILPVAVSGHLADLRQTFSDLGEERARTVVQGIIEGLNVDLRGAREPAEIVDRLFRKFVGHDDPAAINAALDLAARLAAVRGTPSDVLHRAGDILEGRAPHAMAELAGVVAAVTASGVSLDLSLDRELGYYTGVAFDLLSDSGVVLGGGGRYDGLVEEFGGQGIQAAGFAYAVDRVIEALP